MVVCKRLWNFDIFGVYRQLQTIIMSTLQKSILKAKLPPIVPVASLGSRFVDSDFSIPQL